MKLVVGTDSTWSLRAWICAQLTGISFDVEVIDLSHHHYKTDILKISPSGLVPALVEENLTIHDSLAIIEYLNECSQGRLFPTDKNERAKSRSLCAELHSGFINLRTFCPFTLNKVMPLVTMDVNIQKELTRLEAIFEEAQLPYMFKSAGTIDAFYAILAYRLNKYGIQLNGKAGQYQQSLIDWSYLKDAIELAERWKSI
jgi:glutathione S-transferase